MKAAELQNLRLSLGYSKAEFARRLGLARDSLLKYENLPEDKDIPKLVEMAVRGILASKSKL